MKKLIFAVVTLFVTESHAEIFKCVDKQKKVHFQDQACTYEKGKLSTYQASGRYEQRDPIEVQNEITKIQNDAIENSNNSYRYYRPESNELIDSQRRKANESQRKWDSLGRAGVTYKNSPSTYYNTQFTNR